MARKRYRFNQQTLSMEQVDYTFGYILRKSMAYILSGVIFGGLFFLLLVFFFPSPREKQIIQERDAIKSQYQVLNRQIDQLQLILTDLQQRDDNLYRVLFGSEPIPLAVRMGVAQQDYDSLLRMTDWQLAADLTHKLNQIERELYVQAKSYEEIVEWAQTQEIRKENIPAIQPVLNKDLTRVASGYGYRVDPVYHVRRFHQGMDFTAPVGTDVYATGNGIVDEVGWKQGYGNTVVIDHGFGYKTLYAHLKKAAVRRGQKVKRGDVIAWVGNTGKSTGPHLHYEVRLKGKAIDPRNYYFQDLSPEEYDKMVQLSNNFGYLLD